MKTALAIVIGLMPLLACGQINKKTSYTLNQAKQEFNLVATEDLTYLNCSSTISESRMKAFFPKYPQYREKVQPVHIPNCYGNQQEKYYILVHEPSGHFNIPNSIRQPQPSNAANK